MKKKTTTKKTPAKRMHPVARRLKVLRAHLAGINPDLFEMTTFKQDAECGTHMCIGGHMANIGEFERRGYHLEPWGKKVIFLPDGREREVPTYMPTMNDEMNEFAIMKALGINLPEVEDLCFDWDPSDHHGSEALKEKLAQIDRLIRKYARAAPRKRAKKAA